MTVDVRRLAGLSGSFFGTGLCLAFGVYNGVQQLTLITTLPWLVIEIVTVSAVPAVLVFTVLATLSGLLLTREVFTSPDPDERLTEGPPITAIVPVYGDGDVLRTSVESLLKSNYRNVSVAIVTEPGDDETIAVAEELASHSDVQVLTNRQPGSKARAINDAVSRLDAEYFCAFDADEWVDPDFVPTAMYALVEEDRDVFQARRVPRANGPVETLAYCERLLFHASYKLVEPLGFTYCRSSSSAFTREAFDAVGGLNDVVTEDIDFAHTCFRQGLDVRQARNLTNEMEAPHTMRDLWGQRKRWRLGHIEVFQKALTGGFEPSGLRGAASTLRLATSLTASVFMVALVSKVAVLAYYGYTKYAVLPLLAVAVTILPVLYYDSRKGHVPDLSWSALLAPLVYPGFGIVTIRCAFEYVFSWDGEWYQVEKTGA
ncbi:family 2 glycosyl transferase [Halovivax asiaticus JCM 14624]|uniref:Family 2 glycosyl transferase n=1 Tax=Halovivax asiaticus JCM 14624 TaxID=1227490 RepID=M0BHY8_9EURY|nr:glycosyltransferase family 2 protein [Halovivax asiaticus]ELZ09269.1 family 2 glycosyl transferase [Halovivax asiaticus JCM 14624]